MSNKRKKCESVVPNREENTTNQLSNKRRKCESSLPNRNEGIDPNQFFANDGVRLDPNNARDVQIINEKILEVNPRHLNAMQSKKLQTYKDNIIRKCAICKIVSAYTRNLILCSCETYVCWGCCVANKDPELDKCTYCFNDNHLTYYKEQQERSLLNKRNQLLDLPYLPKDLWHIVFYYTHCVNDDNIHSIYFT